LYFSVHKNTGKEKYRKRERNTGRYREKYRKRERNTGRYREK
jgi:hypothetical protein